MAEVGSGNLSPIFLIYSKFWNLSNPLCTVSSDLGVTHQKYLEYNCYFYYQVFGECLLVFYIKINKKVWI